MKLKDRLTELDACQEGLRWVGDRSLAKAWIECERADWMLWGCTMVGVDRRLVVRAAGACARTALQYVPAGEDRPRLAIEAAEAWADCPSDAAAYAANAAARNAADAAYAACAAANAAADAAADAAYAAAYSACAAADAAAGYTHIAMCNLIRGIIPLKEIRKAMKEENV
jgi:hypothetical protein